MTIDTKRLKTDAAYWDECGAGYYRYAFTTGPDWDGAKNMVGTVEFAHMDGSKNEGSWLSLDACSWVPFAVKPESTTRPTNPAAPEWDGEGLPPVGCECEALISGYEKVFVVGYNYEKKLVVEVLSSGMHIPVSKKDVNIFRPIRTKEQRQRGELADLIEKHQMENGSFCTPENTAEAILSRYNLEPKP